MSSPARPIHQSRNDVDRRNFVKTSIATTLGAALFKVLPANSAMNDLSIQLRASRGEFRLSPDQAGPTQVMFYNQAIPGPVIKIPQGVESVIEFDNALDVATSVHWHGLRIDNAMDGVPGMTQALIEPGEKFNYRLTPPDAGTYWYHTHQRAWQQLTLGLAGVLIVEEANPPMVDQDLVFAIDDWRLGKDMQIDSNSLGSLRDWAHAGRMGNRVTVNGEMSKGYSVSKGQRVRFRMVNIANSRIMSLRIDQPDVSAIAIDGQPVKPFQLDDGRLTLAPGQRADLMIDMTSDPGHISPIELLIEGNAYRVAEFHFDDKIAREKLLETDIALPANPANRVVLPEAMVNIPLHIEGGAMGGMRGATYQGKQMTIDELMQKNQIWAFNGVAGLPEKPLFKVKRGSGISLDIVNDNSWPHAIHVHGHHFIADQGPETWRDTLLFNRQQKGSIKFLADNPGKWLIHCHMIEHQAGGMTTWFEVT
jgi:FtsP/CotA-like multicopper oxidase with cupredoxin domain